MFKFKHLLLAILALGGVSSLSALDYASGNPPYVSQYGSKMKADSAIFAGSPKEAVCIHGILANAAVNITVGDALVMVGTTFPLSVSKTTTPADPAFIGIALTTASYGNEVQVCRAGKVKATTAVNSTYAQKMVTSGTAGRLTPASSVTEAAYTGLSNSAIAGRAGETKTISGASGTILFVLP